MASALELERWKRRSSRIHSLPWAMAVFKDPTVSLSRTTLCIQVKRTEIGEKKQIFVLIMVICMWDCTSMKCPHPVSDFELGEVLRIEGFLFEFNTSIVGSD